MTEQKEIVPAAKPEIKTGVTVTGGLVPTDFDGLYRFCSILHESKLMPKKISS